MIGARRDNAFRAHARRLTGADRPRCPLRGLVNYSAARVRKRERKERRKEKGTTKRKKGEKRKEGIRADKSFFSEWNGTRGDPYLAVVSLSAPCSASFRGGGGVGSIRRVFYCPKTDRYQDYVLPSTSTLVSTIESDTKPVNRREEEGGGES